MDELLACTHEDTLTILASISFQPHQAGLQGDSLLTGINELAMNDKGENNLLRPSLRSLYEDGRVPHDVWLLCGPCEVSNEGHDVEKVGAHKFMLAARSPVFCAMFHGGMAESQGSEVRIEDFSASVVEAFVRFLYTDWCDYDVLQLCGKDLLAIADKYQVPALLELCESELISSLRPEDAVSLLKLADSHNAARLRARALEYIVDNAERTAQYAQELSPELMQDLLFAVAKRK
jgi:speckle-type POZ protein